jgi:hypothetical protein
MGEADAARASRRPIRRTMLAVRVKSRHAPQPERSFLRLTLIELAPRIDEELQAAVAEAVRP